MSDKSIYLHLSVLQNAFDITELFSVFDASHIRLEHPQSGVVKMLDNIGEVTDHTRCNLIDLSKHMDQIHFQWWFDEQSDLYCRIRFHSNQTIIDLGLDGVSINHELLLLKCLSDLLCMYLKRSLLLGYIIDQTGRAVDHDISELFL